MTVHSFRNARREARRPAVLDTLAVPDEDQTAWLVTFSDLVLQLFAFVVVALVMGQVRPPVRAPAAAPVPERRATRAPAPPRTVANAPAELPATAEHRGLAAASQDQARPAAPGPPPSAAAVLRSGSGPAAAAGPASVAASADLGRLQAAGSYLKSFVEAAGMADGATITISDSEVVLSLSDTIGFPSGSAELLPAAASIIDQVGALASAMSDFGIDVAGHTDDVPIHTAAFPSNLELSLARAARVARQLSADDPALARRTVAAGFGEHRPIASNADPDGRARNRRVELRLVPIVHSTE